MKSSPDATSWLLERVQISCDIDQQNMDTPWGDRQTLFRFIEILRAEWQIYLFTKFGRLLHFVSKNVVKSAF
jgi:hypothetical protein